MGGSISKLRGHFITRPAQRFNIETRTEKVLSQDMPVPAPKFKADIESRQSNLEENWKQMDKDIRSKDFTHSERLKDVSLRYVLYRFVLHMYILVRSTFQALELHTYICPGFFFDRTKKTQGRKNSSIQQILV